MKVEEKRITDYNDKECYAYQRGYRHGAEAEVEIAFKAGLEDEKAHWISEIERQVNEAHISGIRKVIEWTEREFGVDWSEEKEQLKKWGIK